MNEREDPHLRRRRRVLLTAARGMREQPTPAEAVLWAALRDRRVDGFKFRRQVPVGRFVLDFCCLGPKLVIEVDGAVHDAQAEQDAERTALLELAGYRVIRFRNHEVIDDLPGVMERIYRELHQLGP